MHRQRDGQTQNASGCPARISQSPPRPRRNRVPVHCSGDVPGVTNKGEKIYEVYNNSTSETGNLIIPLLMVVLGWTVSVQAASKNDLETMGSTVLRWVAFPTSNRPRGVKNVKQTHRTVPSGVMCITVIRVELTVIPKRRMPRPTYRKQTSIIHWWGWRH